MKRLLVVVDMQNDFIDGALGTKEAVNIVTSVIERIEEAVKLDEDIVFTRDTHHDDYLSTQEGEKLPVVHCVEGTDGWQICDEVKGYAEGRKIFDKPAFGSIELMNYVRENKYDRITLIGLCTDICVISNAILIRNALPEARVSVKVRCMAGTDPSAHNNALSVMRKCQIEVE